MPRIEALIGLAEGATERLLAWGARPLDQLGTHEKGAADFVTQVDLEMEEWLRESLGRLLPEAAFLGEESGLSGDPGGLLWVVDPLDGTTNFSRGLYPWGFSVGLLQGGVPQAGVMAVPNQGWLVATARGQGAWQAGRRLSLEAGRLDPRSLIGIGILENREFGGWVTALGRSGARFRQTGSAVAHLAGVALGHLDLAAQARTRIWDLAAGALAIEEAGGRVCRMDGSPLLPFRPGELAGDHLDFLAGNRETVHEALVLLG